VLCNLSRASVGSGPFAAEASACSNCSMLAMPTSMVACDAQRVILDRRIDGD
jgi:hypothetical protein